MSQRFSLDRPTFERLLAAAALVQQMQTQALRFAYNASNAQPLLTLVEIQQAIQTGALDLEAAVYQVTSLALKLTGAHGAGVWLFTQDAFVFRAGAGTASNSERLRLAVLAGLADTEQTPDAANPGDLPHYSKAKSLLVAPIYQGPRISGALAVFTEAENAFSDCDAANTRLLAGILAHALDKAAEAELKHSVILERAAMQKVVERLIPSLMRLTSHEPLENVPALSSTQSLPVSAAPVLATNPTPVLSPAVSPSSPMTAIPVDAAAHEPEDILSSVGSLRQPERTFSREAELAETNPRWVHSLNPGFERWVHVGPSQPAAAPAICVAPVNIAEPAPVLDAILPQQQTAPVVKSPALPAAPNAAASAGDSVPVLAPLSGLAPAIEKPGSKTTELAAWFFQSTKSLVDGLTSIPRLRLSVRFSFHYKPALRAMSLGLAALVLSLVAFLALRSGEAAMLTTQAADSSSTPAKPVNPVQVSNATATTAKVPPVIARATKVPRHAQRPQSIPRTTVDTSHLRITDMRAANALSGLSKYEIASLERRAEYGDDTAAFVLGMAYEVGHGVQRSCAHAAKWVTRAAHQGNAAAEYNLALRYRTGDGVKADPDEAEKWLRKAARRRYPGARPVLAAENLHGPRAAGQP